MTKCGIIKDGMFLYMGDIDLNTQFCTSGLAMDLTIGKTFKNKVDPSLKNTSVEKMLEHWIVWYDYNRNHLEKGEIQVKLFGINEGLTTSLGDNVHEMVIVLDSMDDFQLIENINLIDELTLGQFLSTHPNGAQVL